MISFFLNGVLTNVQKISADTTLLRYLRSDQGLVATKEGCGSGDCGACSVLLGEKIDGQWRYKAINSCITFAVQLAGKSVITVEQLTGRSGAGSLESMHPAQQAMVEYHGAQCGFCTPGIITSLVALHERLEGSMPNHEEIMDALSGNLCRCTGYRPIIEAAEKMHNFTSSSKPAVHVWQPQQSSAQQSFSDQSAASQEASQQTAPSSEAVLQQVLANNPDVRIVAGGTDLTLEVTQQLRPIEQLVSIANIESLKTIEIEDEAILVGAAVTYAEVEPVLKDHFPEFAQLLHRLGSRQVRNNGTMVGNIANASPIGDCPPVLLALGACIEIVSAGVNTKGANSTRWIPLHEFFIDYKKTALQAGEYIRCVRIPRLKENQVLKVFKISKRLEDDISAVLAAFKLTLRDSENESSEGTNDNRIVERIQSGFGGMAAIPKAALTLEKELTGKTLSSKQFKRASEKLSADFKPMDDVRASAQYRMQVAKNLVLKCALEIHQPNSLSRIEAITSQQLSSQEVFTHA